MKNIDKAIKIRKKLSVLVPKYDKMAKSLGEPTYINTIGEEKWAFLSSTESHNKKETTKEKNWFRAQMEVAYTAQKKGLDLQQKAIKARNQVQMKNNNILRQKNQNGGSTGSPGGDGYNSNNQSGNIGNTYVSDTLKAVHGKYDQEDYGSGKISTGKRSVEYPNGVVKVGGSKSWRNNNPGNITGMGKKLLFGAIGIAYSKTGDEGDQAQLVFKSTQDGFNAMVQLMLKSYSGAPIYLAFDKYQTDKKSFANKLADLAKHGISNTRVFSDLSKEERQVFVEVWAKWEGYKKGRFGGTRKGDRKTTTGNMSTEGSGKFYGGNLYNSHSGSGAGGSWGSSSSTNNAEISSSGSVSDFASQFIGRAYSQEQRGVKGGEVLTTSNSYDCSSFVGMVMQEKYGIPYSKFGKTTEPQYRYCKSNFNHIPRNKIQEGDVIFYNHSGPGYVSHVAIAVSNSEMIHARGKKYGVQKTKIYSKNYKGAFRPAEGGSDMAVQNGTQTDPYINKAVKQITATGPNSPSTPALAVQTGASLLSKYQSNYASLSGLKTEITGLNTQMSQLQANRITNGSHGSPKEQTSVPTLSASAVL